MNSPFLSASEDDWFVSNELAFAVYDGYPISPSHSLVITKRLVATWFEATAEEQTALMDLVNVVKERLDETLKSKPDGYNVGFNAGAAAGQTVPHVHIHVIPRFAGDSDDPRGGIRWVLREKACYW